MTFADYPVREFTGKANTPVLVKISFHLVRHIVARQHVGHHAVFSPVLEASQDTCRGRRRSWRWCRLGSRSDAQRKRKEPAACVGRVAGAWEVARGRAMPGEVDAVQPAPALHRKRAMRRKGGTQTGEAGNTRCLSHIKGGTGAVAIVFLVRIFTVVVGSVRTSNHVESRRLPVGKHARQDVFGVSAV